MISFLFSFGEEIMQQINKKQEPVEALLKDINQLFADLQNINTYEDNDIISRTAFYILATTIPEITSF